MQKERAREEKSERERARTDGKASAKVKEQTFQELCSSVLVVLVYTLKKLFMEERKALGSFAASENRVTSSLTTRSRMHNVITTHASWIVRPNFRPDRQFLYCTCTSFEDVKLILNGSLSPVVFSLSLSITNSIRLCES